MTEIESSAPAVAPVKRILTNVGGLDQILGGGLVRGAAYIIQGPPGAGKTVLANNIAFNVAADGGKALYLTLLAESFDRMLTYVSVFDFFDPTKIARDVYYESVYSNLQTGGLKGLSETILREIQTHKPRVLILDGLFITSEVEPVVGEFRKFIHTLAIQAALADVTMLLLTNASRVQSAPEYTMVDGWIELHNDEADADAARSLIVHKQRGGAMLHGHHSYKLSDAGFTAFPRLETTLGREPVTGASERQITTGIADLDEMTFGGIPEQSSTAIIGPTGSGKTTIGLQFLSCATAEAPGLMFGFFEPPERLANKARSIGFDLHAAMAEDIVRVHWRSPIEYRLDELGHDIVARVSEAGARRVVIDGVNAFGKSMSQGPRIHAFLRALTEHLKALGATTMFTCEVADLFFPNELGVQGLSGMIDNTLLVHYSREKLAVQRHATILKLRDSDFDHRSREFMISSEGVFFKHKTADVGEDGLPLSAVLSQSIDA